MGKDYYQVLGVPAAAPSSDIAKSFRVLALTYHPAKHSDTPTKVAEANFKFAEVCEAYDVLSNVELREIYDRYGEELLKTGVPPEKTEQTSKKNPGLARGGYRFSGNTQQIFENFFGTSNPFTITLDVKGNLISALDQIKLQSAPCDEEPTDCLIDVPCTLEEFFYGCQKEITFERLTVSKSLHTVHVPETFSRIIEVRPGMCSTKVLRYPGEGHIRFAKSQGDLIVKLTTAAHPKFKRVGDDIVYSHKIALVDALKSIPIHFTNIDGEMIEVAVDEVISPQSEKMLPAKGMPVLNDDPLGPIKRNFKRGALKIKFDIEFPSKLTEAQRKDISAILDEADETSN